MSMGQVNGLNVGQSKNLQQFDSRIIAKSRRTTNPSNKVIKDFLQDWTD